MEEKKQSKTWLIVILILILVGALCVSIYYIYILNKKVTELEEYAIRTSSIIREINKKVQEENVIPATELKTANGTSISKITQNIDFMDKVFKRLNFVQTLEFTSTNKITEKEIHNLLIGYFSVNGFADGSKYSQAEVKQLVKDALNKDYSGSFKFEAEGEGESRKSIAVSNIQKEGNNYIVKYAVMNHIDADVSDDVAGYYEAKLDENLTLISNKKINK